MERIIVYPDKIKARGYGALCTEQDVEKIKEYSCLAYYSREAEFDDYHVIYLNSGDIIPLYIRTNEFDLLGGTPVEGRRVKIIELPWKVPEKCLGQTGILKPHKGNFEWVVKFDDGDFWFFDTKHFEVID